MKNKFKTIIFYSLFLIIGLLLGYIVYMKIGKSEGEKEIVSAVSSNISVSSIGNSVISASSKIAFPVNPVESSSPSDEEIISSILKDADAEAAKGQYEKALSIIEEGTKKYPDNNQLNEKKNEYKKKIILQDAEDSHSAGDYPSAISILQEGLKSYPDDKEITNLLAKYSSEYKETMKQEAGDLASDHEFGQAVDLLYALEDVIGQDDEIDTLIRNYVDADYHYWSNLEKTTGYYGIFCGSYHEKEAAEEEAVEFKNQGFSVKLLYSNEWENLQNGWYVVNIGEYDNEDKANANLKKVQAVYSEAYVKFTGKKQEAVADSSDTTQQTIQKNTEEGFYSIWCESETTYEQAEEDAEDWANKGYSAQIYNTSNWSNLTDGFYAVAIGKYNSEEVANADLSNIQALYPEAYVKYSGEYQD